MELFPLLKPISFATGDVIYRKGAPSRTLYFLLSGEIDVYRSALDLDNTSVIGASGSGGAKRPPMPFGAPTQRLTPSNEIDLTADQSGADWTGLSRAPTSVLSAEGEVLVASRTGTALRGPRGVVRTSKHQGVFGQAALLGRRREATLVARSPCEALLIGKEDLQRLFEGDAISARRACVLLLEDFMRMDRLSMLALRLRILALGREVERDEIEMEGAQGGQDPKAAAALRHKTKVRACLVLQFWWRRVNDQLARDNDPIYGMFASATEPTSKTRWAGRQHMSFRRGATGELGGSGKRSGGESKQVTEHLLDLKKLVLDMRSRIDRLEQGGTYRAKVTTPKIKKGVSLQGFDGSRTPPSTEA